MNNENKWETPKFTDIAHDQNHDGACDNISGGEFKNTIHIKKISQSKASQESDQVFLGI
jgi:hypothetical protein